MYTVPELALESYSALSDIIQQPCDSDIWSLANKRDSIETVVSLNVFGTTGNRHSLLVVEKNSLSTDFAGKNGRWMLTRKCGSECHIEFLLEWAIEICSSSYIVLCGRETPAPFTV